jgi:DNA polymerase-3 subunit epsilon
MHGLRRRWLARRHRHDGWATLFDPPPRDEWVALDLETTGLDPRRDAILSLAAVPVRGARIELSRRFERLVQPGRDFGIDSIRHHRIVPQEVAEAAPVDAVVAEFLRWLGPRRLLGYHLGFDLAMLAPAVGRLLGHGLPNPCSDVAHRYARFARLAQPRGDLDLSLEHIAARLELPLLARHTALGDACTAALAWLALDARERGAGGSGAAAPQNWK